MSWWERWGCGGEAYRMERRIDTHFWGMEGGDTCKMYFIHSPFKCVSFVLLFFFHSWILTVNLLKILHACFTLLFLFTSQSKQWVCVCAYICTSMHLHIDACTFSVYAHTQIYTHIFKHNYLEIPLIQLCVISKNCKDTIPAFMKLIVWWKAINKY